MTTLPILYVIFFMAVLFQPPDVNHFAVQYKGQELEWTAENKGWQGTIGEHDLGVWSVREMTVTTRKDSESIDTDLAPFLKGSEANDEKVVIQGVPIAVTRSGKTVTLSQEEGGIFQVPLVIKYSKK